MWHRLGAMALSEEEFGALIDAGCAGCRSKLLAVDALVPQKVQLLEGEPYGAPTWGYKGEDLVRGAYGVACEACKKVLYESTACPRCGAEGGIERALAEADDVSLPKACVACGGSFLTATAFVPARVDYDGKRASRPRAQAAPEEPGFHAVRIECKACREATELIDPCPLCRQREKALSGR
jgi:RNA polymerase subunit RPABC4/transcription elongation factor Spt4